MITICTECPHCKEEIEIEVLGNKILIGEEGKYKCPSCKKWLDYEIRVLTTKQPSKTEYTA